MQFLFNRPGFLTLQAQPVYEKENSEFKLVKLQLKIDIVLHPVHVEGLDIYFDFHIYGIFLIKKKNKQVALSTIIENGQHLKIYQQDLVFSKSEWEEEGGNLATTGQYVYMFINSSPKHSHIKG